MQPFYQTFFFLLCSLGIHICAFCQTNPNIPFQNDKLQAWIKEVENLCNPDKVHICDGSQQEYDFLCEEMVKLKSFIRLNDDLRPDCFLSRSSCDDVARLEDRTFICSINKEDAGPTNHWRDPVEMRSELKNLFKGCMRGRTMYVIPFSMGPIGSPIAQIGVEITDSPYVVCSMRIMTRMGSKVLNELANKDFVPCLHSVGAPLLGDCLDTPWPCNRENKYIVHFPETKEIWSFGSGYGGNALLAKKCFALRIASQMGREEGWLAEHMLILGIENPKGEKKYFAAAFPSACGKTNLAMLKSSLPGWKITLIGDDIAWMKIKEDGRLYAINPEAGMFGVAPGTSYRTNPNAMETIQKDTIFTNVGLTLEGDVWWEGMTKEAPGGCLNWLGEYCEHCPNEKIAHPNARFATPIKNCPCIDEAFEDPEGVPISAILFGGRRQSVIPLVTESFDWQNGTFFGTIVSSESTAAANGTVGVLRHDPFAMLPFCGYHMGDYFNHWLSFEKRTDPALLPKIFYVNWFLKDLQGNYLWPGFGENGRVLKWIFERLEGHADAKISPIGYLPTEKSLDLEGLPLEPEALRPLLEVDPIAWLEEVKELRKYYRIFKDKFPLKLLEELQSLEHRLLEHSAVEAVHLQSEKNL